MSNASKKSALNNNAFVQLSKKKDRLLLRLLCIAAIGIAAIGFTNMIMREGPIDRVALQNKSQLASAPVEVVRVPNQNITQCQAQRKELYGVTLGDIHSINPYDNFAPQTYDIAAPDVAGWGLDRSIFDKILDIVKPKFMVEVGSWKGASAIYFAKKMREINGPDACIQLICVDTWLGTTVAWDSKDMDKPDYGNTLYLRNGYPSVYYQFLYNIIDQKVDDIVIPFPLPGVMGSIFLERHGAKPDTVYIDGCHDYLCVLQDLEAWFPLIAENGIIMGDDFGGKEVKKAVDDFCTEERKCRLEKELSSGATYVLRKTG